MPPTKLTKAEQKRQRLEAAKAAAAKAAQAQRRTRTVRLGLIAGGLVVVALLLVLRFVVFNDTKQASTAAIPSTPATSAAGRADAPPWAVPADASAAVAKAGLPMLGAEGTALHIHVHLDITVNGQKITVPALIGIDTSKQKISPLHTHDTTGIVHVESPTQASFSLGQFFTEWQVALSSTGIGGLTADGTHQLKAYVNGQPYTGDPAAIIFKPHDEIALVYGTPDQQTNVPTTYQFPDGY
jgi:hypothetical protein